MKVGESSIRGLARFCFTCSGDPLLFGHYRALQLLMTNEPYCQPEGRELTIDVVAIGLFQHCRVYEQYQSAG